MSIQDAAILVDLTLGKFTNKVEDKEAQQKLVEIYECDSKAISSKKTILSKPLKPILAIFSQCYTYHIKTTLPWEDRSWRLLPYIKFFDYTEEIRSYKDQLTTSLIELEKTYQNDILNDEPFLKGLQKISDYPTFENLAKQFKIEMNVGPVASSEDFRIKCGNDTLDDLKKSFEERQNGLLDKITKDLYTRLTEPLVHLVTTLVDPSTKSYHKSLLTNIESAANLVASYNLTNDQNIIDIINKINKTVLTWDVKTLKVDAPSKEQIINQANDILLEINEKTNT